MTEYCYLEIACRREHLDKLLEHFDNGDDGYEIVEDEEDWICIGFDETNYGWTDNRDAAAKAGVPFFGYHGEGGTFGSSMFASDGEKMLECSCNRGLEPTVRVNELGCIIDQDLVSAREFIVLQKKAKKIVTGEEDD